jgi:hypothetical protein
LSTPRGLLEDVAQDVREAVWMVWRLRVLDLLGAL